MIFETLTMADIIGYGMNLFCAVIEYDGRLSFSGYIMLAIMLSGIIGGLSWCFYRAMKRPRYPFEPQRHDEIGA